MAHNQDLTRLFGSIAPDYDFANHTLSLGLDYYWRRILVRSLNAAPSGLLLDIAAGTFDVSILLGKVYSGRKVLALDPCLPMLKSGLPKICRAEKKGLKAQSILPLAGDAFCLPLPDNSVAAITVSFGLRNMQPGVDALKEMLRVLAPGGRLSVLEFGSAGKKSGFALNPWFALYRFYLFKILPHIGGFISGQRQAYEYLAQSIALFPKAEELKEIMLEAGFERVEYKKLSGGIVYLHCADKKN
ncbi:MAG: ubiquinone/menaquinone biosynthesis methyltransferase [Deltaproteobacteria bacterium]|nr:ubiquinone/menaquinone biosynthesis methyltransferase [Deltaproteobacteria bacterium]